MSGEPDFATVARQLTDLGRRVTALENHRRLDAIDRKASQVRIEEKVDGLYDILAQFRGIFRFFKWTGASVAFVAVVLGLISTIHALGWIK